MSSYAPPEPWASAMVAAGLVNPRLNYDSPSMGQLAKRAGLAVETVRRMIRGIGEPEPTNVERVARALRVDLAVVSEWVYRAHGAVEPYRPPPDADLLSREEREAVDRVINLFAANRKQHFRVMATGSGKSSNFADVVLSDAVVVELKSQQQPADVEDYDVKAAHHSPEPAGKPEPEQP